jgi:N-acetylmuramoyl-L-alanine amidase
MKKIPYTYGLLLFIATTFLSFIPIKNNTKVKKPFVVVLDAGHGGHDPGNLGNGFKEKDIALKIVLQVGKELEKHPDIKVIYTRKTDVFVDLYERGQIANKANADLFVSVHCNSHNSQAHGTETFVLGLHANKQNFEIAKKENQVIYLEENYESKYAGYDINSPESVIGLTIMQEEFLDQSIQLAKNIQDNFTHTLKRVNRGVKQAGFIVLHQTYMPSVLVEAGFLTYRPEGEYLNSKNGQIKVAAAIAKAILEYKKAVEVNVGLDTSYETVNTTTKEENTSTEEVTHNSTTSKETTGATNGIKESTANTTETKERRYVYKVQLAASTKKIPLKPENFKGLKNVSIEPFNKFYRYLYGEASTYKAAQTLKNEAVMFGYPKCYIVAYKDGKRVPITAKMQAASN